MDAIYTSVAALAISVNVPYVTWRDLLAGFIGFCLLPVTFVLIVVVFDP